MENRKPASPTGGYMPVPDRRPPAIPKPFGGSSADNEEEGSRLIVGRNIQLKGEITACDTLVVEGRVEASMNSRMIQVSEAGLFDGEATVETAEIAGRFEGSLTARERLLVRSTGKITGKVRYGRVEIEDGGEIAGEIGVLSADAREKSGATPASQGAKSGDGTAASARPPVPNGADSPPGAKASVG
ncbi:bactofilin family protein [Oceanibaculum indicum]|nr:polymer-forming cytoskeletal protein [Oceanibaculum indicum]